MSGEEKRIERLCLAFSAELIPNGFLREGQRSALDTLLALAINQANLAPLAQNPEFQKTYSGLSSSPPDSLRRPVRVRSIATSLGVPQETARRRVANMAKDGFLTLTGEYSYRNPTNRSDLDPRVTPNKVTGLYGDPQVETKTVYANFGLPLNEAWKLYGLAGYQNRKGESAAFPRLADNANNYVSVYPNGYVPKITTDIDDYNLAFGAKGEVGGFTVDAAVNYGNNKVAYGTINSLNASLGPTSPTRFKDGSMQYGQTVASLDGDLELVLDADALNLIARDPGLQNALAHRGQPAVLTPHPAEAARLLGSTTAEVQADRVAAACRLAHSLKGAASALGLTPLVDIVGPLEAMLRAAGPSPDGEQLQEMLAGLREQLGPRLGAILGSDDHPLRFDAALLATACWVSPRSSRTARIL